MERMDRELDRLVAWIRREDRPETLGRLLVPGVTSGRPAFSPNIPALGLQELRRKESGLLAPVGRDTSFLDLLSTYATAKDATGQVFPIGQIEPVLAELPLKSTVTALGRLVTVLEVHGLEDPKFRDAMVEAFCPPPWLDKIRGLVMSGERVFTSPHVALMLTRLALVHCPDTEGRTPLPAIGALLLALADHLYSGVRAGNPGFELELARNGLFYDTTPPKMRWGRYRRIWEEMAPATSGEAFVDVTAAVEAATGVPLETYMTLCAGLYLQYYLKATELHTDEYWTPEYLGSLVLPPDQVGSFVQSLSADREWFRAQIADTFSSWDFTPMKLRPALRHGTDLALFSTEFLLENGTGGIYYTVMDQIRGERGHPLAWTGFFGRLWERYVGAILDECIPDRSRILTEADLLAHSQAPACDRVVLYPEERLLVEAVGKRITLPSAATGGWEDMQRDLAHAVTEKARQLSGTVERLRGDQSIGGVSGARPVFLPAVVLPGPFPHIPHIVRRLRASIANEPKCRDLMADDVYPLMVLEAKDFEALMGTAAAGGLTAAELLRAWQTGSLADTSFWNWITSERPDAVAIPRSLDDAADSLLDRAVRLFEEAGPGAGGNGLTNGEG